MSPGRGPKASRFKRWTTAELSAAGSSMDWGARTIPGAGAGAMPGASAGPNGARDAALPPDAQAATVNVNANRKLRIAPPAD